MYICNTNSVKKKFYKYTIHTWKWNIYHEHIPNLIFMNFPTHGNSPNISRVEIIIWTWTQNRIFNKIHINIINNIYIQQSQWHLANPRLYCIVTINTLEKTVVRTRNTKTHHYNTQKYNIKYKRNIHRQVSRWKSSGVNILDTSSSKTRGHNVTTDPREKRPRKITVNK